MGAKRAPQLCAGAGTEEFRKLQVSGPQCERSFNTAVRKKSRADSLSYFHG